MTSNYKLTPTEKNQEYDAVWLSYSSATTFTACPKAFYYQKQYKNPYTNRKVNITNISALLGLCIHELLDDISDIPPTQRAEQLELRQLVAKFLAKWKKIEPRIAQAVPAKTLADYQIKGASMLKTISSNKAVLLNPTVKLHQESIMPRFWLSKDQGIILCGKIDWLSLSTPVEGVSAVDIIDFKTGKNEEATTSMQLPIYVMLARYINGLTTNSVSYWYLENDGAFDRVTITDTTATYNKLLGIGMAIKEAKKSATYTCPKTECFYCRPYNELHKFLTTPNALTSQVAYIGLDSLGREEYIVS